MGAFASLEENVVTRLGVAGSVDRLPFVVVDGPLEGDGYVVTAEDNALTDLTYKVIDSSPIANEVLDISVTGDHIVVTLETTTGAKATAAQISSDQSDNTGKLDLAAINMGTAGNSLKVVISDVGADDVPLACSMGGTGNNTLTIRLGKTGASTDSTKNTITLIAAAINAIVTNKKIDATGSGVQSKKITLAAAAADFSNGVDSILTPMTAQELIDELNDHATWTDLVDVAGASLYTGDAESLTAENPNIGDADIGAFAQTAFSNPSLTGSGVDTQGFSEAMVLLTVGTISPAGALDVKIQDSADNSTFADIDDAVFATLTDLDSNTVRVGRLKIDGNTVRRYIKVVSVLDPDDQVEYAEHSVVFLLSGNQYLAQDEVPVDFTL